MRYETIKQAGRRNDLPAEWAIRKMVKSKRCPGFYSGTRFYVDTEALAEQLAEESKKAVVANG